MLLFCSSNLKPVRKKGWIPFTLAESMKLKMSEEMVFLWILQESFLISARSSIPEPIKEVIWDLHCQEAMDLEHPQSITDSAVSSFSTYICSSVEWIC